MVCYSHLFKNFPQLVVVHRVKGFGIVNKTEGDVLLEFSCFFYDQMDVGNLISGSSGFSKSSLNIWKFSIHILLKPSLRDFELYVAIRDRSKQIKGSRVETYEFDSHVVLELFCVPESVIMILPNRTRHK